MLKGKRIVLGVSGSIAAYKAADVASKLVQAGALVDVVLTAEAARFVTPLTFSSLTHQPVVHDLFDLGSELALEHVALARRADAVLIAPATANTIAKLALGLADDALTATALATEAPLLVAPAMDGHMWENPATRQNVRALAARGVTIVGPGSGYLASGMRGVGRLAETVEILGVLRQVLGKNGDLAGTHIVVTAGGTQEPIDPVRVITNRSSGKMGYAIAEAARDRGARVTLVAAPVALGDPPGVTVVRAATAQEMAAAVAQAVKGAQALIMAAAVADFQAAAPALQKIKKSGAGLTLELVAAPDILSQTKGVPVRVGFAAESTGLLANARAKLKKKSLDLIVANDITEVGSGFGAESNRVVILDRAGKAERLPLLPKYDVAWRILDRVAPLLRSKKKR
ncbi:MAG: bifunctional phosphopantothenoylcysteine decarboxylase/phosphopantothenate--cysteine ligase CoaBC [Dehalococcoidia bacterium]|nr:bifunctional phosphopantothenoylcysteine decarboxylase/phosphopantothenate--cysteine ligase CoaBC [Dehalococcoidia bacterium]